MNLKQKLFGPLLLIVTIPVIIVGGLAYFYISDITQESLISSISDVSTSLSPSINVKINTAETNLRLFASSRLLQDYIIRDEQRYALLQATLIRQLREYQYVYPDYFSMKLILENGEVDSIVDNRQNPDVVFDVSDWRFYEILAASDSDEMLVYVEQEADTGRYILSLGLPIHFQAQFSQNYGNEEIKRNFFTLSLYLDYIEDVLTDITLPEESFIVVVDPQENMLFSSGDYAVNFQSKKLSINPAQDNFSYINNSKNTYFVSTVPLAFGFNLYAAVPTTKFNQSANELAIKMAMLLVAIIFFIFLVSFLYIRGLLLTPIYLIEKLVGEIALGVMDSDVLFSSRKDEIGTLSESIVGMRSKIRDNNRKIEKLAYFDELTGLPNRFTLQFELTAAIARANRSSKKFAIIFIDLDNFKNVNDTLGHDVGDQLLIEAANRIKRNLRIEDYIVSNNTTTTENSTMLARLGGDEFTVLIADVIEPNTLEKPLSRVINSLSSPFLISGKEMSVGASLGVAIFPDDGKESKDLLKSADLAMYEAKRNGKNCFAFFSQEMNIDAYERQALEAALRNAEKNGELSLHYQPRIKVDDFSIEGFEALLRWNNKDLGNVPPSNFIHVAESNLQILQIGNWVINQACQKIKHWTDMGYKDFRLAVNVSTVQLYRADLVGEIKEALQKNGISGEYLEIEITESALLEDEAQAIIKLSEIKKLGVRIALDDFGTGYSSLSILRLLPIDILKVDQSFIADITNNQDSADVFQAIVQLAKKLRLVTVAEGIEMAKQHELILLSQCDHAQGYYYSRPMVEKDADEYVSKALLKLEAMSASDN